MKPIKIVALLAIHNRKNYTVRCLESLRRQLHSRISLKLVVVDDACKDGSPEAIRQIFPNCEIVLGDGELYWAGGMRLGWERSVKHAEFDYLLVLNDDIEFANDGFAKLINEATTLASAGHTNFVVVGSCIDSKSSAVTYGGMVRRSRFFPTLFERAYPSSTLTEVDSLNMNVALISEKCAKSNNFLAEYFVHGGADIEFGIRARKNGGKIFLSGEEVAFCTNDHVSGTSREPGITPWQRFRRMHSIKELPFRQRVLFLYNHGGLIWPILLFGVYLKLFLELLSHVCKSISKRIARMLPN